MVRAADLDRGDITCSHVGCGTVNVLQMGFYYDENIVNGLPDFGALVYVGNPAVTYPLRFGPNVIGTADTSAVRVERYQHGGQCFISRRHCTLTLTFDKWAGQLRYQLQDGAVDPATQTMKPSLNGTLLNGTPVQKGEIIDVGDGDVLTLGGIDRFRLEHAVLNPAMLETYKIDLAYNPDRTQ